MSSVMKRLLPGLFAAFVALGSSAALAQGIPHGLTGTITPYAQTAAVDDTWAMHSNPAGLAFVDALQVVGGYSGEFGIGARPRHRLLLQSAFSPVEGFALGGAAQYVVPTAFGATPMFTNSFTMAFRFDRTLAIGTQLHTFTSLDPNQGPGAVRFLGDMGFQIRPLSWLSMGFAFENLGAVKLDEASKMRAGVSLRPFGKYLTVGTDVRFEAGHPNLFTNAAFSQGRLLPSANVKLQALGGVLYAGVMAEQFDWSFQSLPLARVGAGIEVNTGHLGALLLGDIGTTSSTNLSANTVQGTMGAFARFSVEEFDSVIPTFSHWITLTLTGAGVPPNDADNIIEEVFAGQTSPLEVMHGLEKASRDEGVEGVVLRLSGLSLGWGRIEELRGLVLKLRAAGKRVVVHLDGGGDEAVYLAAAADKIYMSPAAALSLDGISVQLMYVKSALDRFGLQAQAITAGEYKSAPQTFIADEPNAAELEVENALLDVLFGRLVEGLAAGRNLSPEKVKALIDKGGLNAEDARRANIVDGIGYFSEVPSLIESDFEGIGKPSLDDSYLDDARRKDRWSDPNRIAIIPVSGTISMSGGGGIPLLDGGGGAAANTIIEALRAAKKDSEVKAVVLRIDSPGGDALASDLIWHAVMDLREEKPVIASMGDVAASGGYYVAAGAQEIFAEPQTITGSIGVFSLMFNAERLASDVGVHGYEINRGANPGPNLLRGLSESERQAAEKQVDWIYERFLTAIKEGRGTDDKKLRAVAGGRVWTGVEAKGHGLVDTLGGLDAALARARELSGLSADEVEYSVLSGDDEITSRLSSAVRVVAGTNATADSVSQTTKFLLGVDPDVAEALLSQRPLALSPVVVQTR